LIDLKHCSSGPGLDPALRKSRSVKRPRDMLGTGFTNVMNIRPCCKESIVEMYGSPVVRSTHGCSSNDNLRARPGERGCCGDHL
jgi:hypothetical protein